MKSSKASASIFLGAVVVCQLVIVYMLTPVMFGRVDYRLSNYEVLQVFKLDVAFLPAFIFAFWASRTSAARSTKWVKFRRIAMFCLLFFLSLNIAIALLPNTSPAGITLEGYKSRCGLITCTTYYSPESSKALHNFQQERQKQVSDRKGFAGAVTCGIAGAGAGAVSPVSAFSGGLNGALVCGLLDLKLQSEYTVNLASAARNGNCFTVKSWRALHKPSPTNLGATRGFDTSNSPKLCASN